MRVIQDDDYLRVEEDAQNRMLVVRRKATRFPSPSDMEHAYLRVFRAPRAEPPAWSLVLDSRDAPASSDDETDRRIKRLSEEAERRFALVVVLVRSAAGMLQGRRISSDVTSPPAGGNAVERGQKTVLTRDPEYALELARSPRSRER